MTFQRWDQDRPWVKLNPETRRVSAVMVGSNRILTTADAVDDATFIQLVTGGKAQKARPRIERVDPTINLALLAIDDTPGLSGLAPVVVAKRTPTSGTLRSVRWRGQQLEVAASRVIRIEVGKSLASETYHAVLHLRTDLSGGGWSEPVFDGSTLVAITMSQSADESQAIPAEMLDLFLREAASGKPVSGVSTLGALYQLNRDSAINGFLGQEGDPRGILVRAVPWGTTGCGVLEPRDVLLEIGGEAIDAEGYVQHPWLGRVGFNEILAERFRPGDPVPVRVLRRGKERALTLTARAHPAGLELVPSVGDKVPPYLIAGGFVIRELDVPYLRTWGKDWINDAPQRLLSRYLFGTKSQTPNRRRIVLLATVLPAPYNLGYQDLKDVAIERVNGRPIGKIEDVVAALERPEGRFHVFTLSAESPRDEIVVEAATLDGATTGILEAYGIPAASRLRAESLPEGGGDCDAGF